MKQCPVCGTKLEEPKDLATGDLMECPHCGTLLEILTLSPLDVALFEEPEK